MAKQKITTVQSSNPYKFAAYRGAALTAVANTFTNLVCDTEYFDTSNNYNNATGVFTAPVDGFYTFNASVVLLAASNRCFVTFLKNGSEYLRGTDVQASLGGTQASVYLQLTAGQTVNAQYYVGAAVGISNSSLTQFSGYLTSTS